MHRAAFTHGDLTQIAAIAEVVSVGEEAGLAIVAALDDVLRQSGNIKSGWAWHGMNEHREEVPSC
jgi:hypothetical protein